MSDAHSGRLVTRVQRTQQVAGSRSHPLLWSSLALLVCIGLLAAALGGALPVRRVEVVGANLPAGAMVNAAAVRGQNIFTVRSDQVVARLIRVREIVVQRVETSLPDQVTIYASLRIGRIAVQRGRQLYEVDSSGAMIRQVQTTRLPVVRVGAAPCACPGALGPGVVAAVRYAVRALRTVPSGSVLAFRYTSANGFIIVGRAGWRAMLGSGNPQTLVNRVATLVSFLASIQGRPAHLQLVDLRGSAPYAKFSSS